MAKKFGIEQWISPIRMLDRLGVAAEDVTDIVLTHAHYDHMGSIDKFPNAQILIQKREILSWVEAMAMPQQFGFLTKALDARTFTNYSEPLNTSPDFMGRRSTEYCAGHPWLSRGRLAHVRLAICDR